MKIIWSDSYRLSERVLIEKGTRFKASGGPYWKTSDGQKVPLNSRGPYTFLAHAKRGAVEWIECLDRDGCFAVLHLAGRRRRIDNMLVARPYKIIGRKLDTKRGRR